MAESVTTERGLPPEMQSDIDDMEAVRRVYPVRINPYYLALIQKGGDPLRRQVVPDRCELTDGMAMDDPLSEAEQSPVTGLIHRYPDRVVLLVSGMCPVLCRFCMRKRLAGRALSLSDDQIMDAVAYIQSEPAIREVILSGGDPLMLSDDALAAILARIGRINHVETVRVHTRTPAALPQRITPALAALLKRYHPLYLNIHMNHPDEVTAEFAAACAMLADAGIPLGSQTVLLKGVNDSADVMKRLMRQLLRNRVRPYYLHHPDLVRGTGHFRVPIERGLAIMRSLSGNISGMAMPRYMIDLPGGGGKVSLLPDDVQAVDGGYLAVRNHRGEVYYYPAGDTVTGACG